MKMGDLYEILQTFKNFFKIFMKNGICKKKTGDFKENTRKPATQEISTRENTRCLLNMVVSHQTQETQFICMQHVTKELN